MLQILGRLERDHIIQKIIDGRFPLCIEIDKILTIITPDAYCIRSNLVFFNCDMNTLVLHKKIVFSFIYFNVLYSFESFAKKNYNSTQKIQEKDFNFLCELSDSFLKSDLFPDTSISNISFTCNDVFYRLYFIPSKQNNSIIQKNNEASFNTNGFFLGEIESIDHKSFRIKIFSYIAELIENNEIPFVYKHIAKHINRDIVFLALKESLIKRDACYSCVTFRIISIKKEDERFLYEQRYNKNYT